MKIAYILYRFLKVCLKLFLGCLLGCVLVLFFASKSEIVHQKIKQSVQNMFQEDLNCMWDGEIGSIDLLYPSITFKNSTITPYHQDDHWTMYVDTFQISASWIYFLWTGTFSCYTYFEDVAVHEELVNGVSKFYQVLGKVFSGSSSHMISYDFTAIKHAQIISKDSTYDTCISYEYNCQTSRESDGVHTKLYFIDGFMQYQGIKVIENFFGNVVTVFPYEYNLHKVYARTDCRFSIPRFQEKGECFLKGDLYNGQGACIISNNDQSFMIQPLQCTIDSDVLWTHGSMILSLDLVQKILLDQSIMQDISGDLTLTAECNLYDIASSLQGKVELSHVDYKNKSIVNYAVASLDKSNDGYDITLSADSQLLLQGSIQSLVDGWKFYMVNATTLTPWWSSYWSMSEHQGLIKGVIDTACSQVSGAYRMLLESFKLSEQIEVEGSFQLNGEQCHLCAYIADQTVDLTIAFKPMLYIASFAYSSDQEVFIDFHQDPEIADTIVGFVGFNCIKNMLPDEYKSSFIESGKINMSGYLWQGTYFADVQTDNAYLKIPALFNVIEQFKAQAQLNFIDRILTVHDLVADLHKGKLYCHNAIAQLDQESNVSFLHAPLFLDNVMMSLHKGIFGILSGRICLSLYPEQTPLLKGNLILDQAQLKGNIFSTEFQEQLFSSVSAQQSIEHACNIDMYIQTKDPIIVETSFLQAQAHVDFHITNHIKEPDVVGEINVVAGELKFPYRSLFITHGKVSMMPKNIFEPMIELVAKGKIKRYNITMRATGTILEQQIHFESSPYLTEEQIISLLLIGSHEGSLSSVMPTMFMQKLHELIFGPALSQSKLNRVFDTLLQSFKNVRIYPQFTNQTGRGGVRGVIEVDATERLHGKIDTNLMQLEDTIFEADYALTDDVTVRAIKDGPSTYGGEVEMRWKFS